MKKLLQLGCMAALLLGALPASAQEVLCSQARKGEDCSLAPRVRAALEALDLGCRRWTIFILNEKEWTRLAKQLPLQGRPVSRQAFTLWGPRRTYLREKAFSGQPDAVLVEVLAHEFAHLRICAANENCAKETAARIVRLLATEEKP